MRTVCKWLFSSSQVIGTGVKYLAPGPADAKPFNSQHTFKAHGRSRPLKGVPHLQDQSAILPPCKAHFSAFSKHTVHLRQQHVGLICVMEVKYIQERKPQLIHQGKDVENRLLRP